MSSQPSGLRLRPSSEPGALWVCPTPAALTTAAVAAALYAFSDLIDEQADPELATVREELCFLVTLHGTAAIERVADALARSRSWVSARKPWDARAAEHRRPRGTTGVVSSAGVSSR